MQWLWRECVCCSISTFHPSEEECVAYSFYKLFKLWQEHKLQPACKNFSQDPSLHWYSDDVIKARPFFFSCLEQTHICNQSGPFALQNSVQPANARLLFPLQRRGLDPSRVRPVNSGFRTIGSVLGFFSEGYQTPHVAKELHWLASATWDGYFWILKWGDAIMNGVRLWAEWITHGMLRPGDEG